MEPVRLLEQIKVQSCQSTQFTIYKAKSLCFTSQPLWIVDWLCVTRYNLPDCRPSSLSPSLGSGGMVSVSASQHHHRLLRPSVATHKVRTSSHQAWILIFFFSSAKKIISSIFPIPFLSISIHDMPIWTMGEIKLRTGKEIKLDFPPAERLVLVSYHICSSVYWHQHNPSQQIENNKNLPSTIYLIQNKTK